MTSAPSPKAAPSAAPPPALEVTELGKRYGSSFSPAALFMRFSSGRDLALRDVSFTVPTGSVVGVLGPNGAGKTTLLKCLLGLLTPNAGSAQVLGHPAGAAVARRKIGALVGRPALIPYLSARKNLEMRARFFPGARERIDSLLERVGLAEAANKNIRAYSTGMRQRAGLAASLLNEPDLWVLDEPTSGLDPRGQAEVRALIREAGAAKNRTVLVSSHNLHEIEQVCDHVILLSHGELRASGPVSELLSQEQMAVEVEVDDPDKGRKVLEKLTCCSKVEDGSDTGGRPVLIATGSPELGAAAARALVGAGLELRSLVPRRRNLEDFFLETIQEAPCT